MKLLHCEQFEQIIIKRVAFLSPRDQQSGCYNSGNFAAATRDSSWDNENYVTPFTSTVRTALAGIVNHLRGKTIECRTGLLRASESSRVAPAGYAGVLRRCH
jgi:hypothetical protein